MENFAIDRDLIVYVESPLQLLSALPNLESDRPGLVIVRGQHVGTYAKSILDGSVGPYFQLCIFEGIFGFCKVLALKTPKMPKRLLIGDPRSVFSLALMIRFQNSEVVLLDDGSYSLEVDRGGDFTLNTRFPRLKRTLFKFLANPGTLTRSTLFSHRITVTYRSVLRHDFRSLVENTASKVFKPINLPVGSSVVHIESSLDGWVDLETERRMYRKLIDICDATGRKLVIIAHRRSCTKKIREKLPSEVEVCIITLDYPVEIFIVLNATEDARYSCAITTALHSLLALNLGHQTYFLKIKSVNFSPTYRFFIENFYSSIDLYGNNFRDIIAI